MNKFCISIKYFIELFVVIMIFVMFLHRCIVLYFRKNRFAAPMMLCINIFLVGILFSIKSICTRYNILFLACASGFFRHIVLFFFFILLIPYVGSLGKCNTSALNALVYSVLIFIIISIIITIIVIIRSYYYCRNMDMQFDNSTKTTRKNSLLIFALLFATMVFCFGSCSARSTSTYVQADLDLHSPLLNH